MSHGISARASDRRQPVALLAAGGSQTLAQMGFAYLRISLLMSTANIGFNSVFGIWFAGPTAEVMMLGATILVLCRATRGTSLTWGVFHSEKGEGI